jgi:hypothetical protein
LKTGMMILGVLEILNSFSYLSSLGIIPYLIIYDKYEDYYYIASSVLNIPEFYTTYVFI